jgi:hypothetical protein
MGRARSSAERDDELRREFKRNPLKALSEAEFPCQRGQSPIKSPEAALRDQTGCKKMEVDPPNALAPQAAAFEEVHDFLVGSASGGRESCQIV